MPPGPLLRDRLPASAAPAGEVSANRGILVIAIFDLVKAALFFVAAAGVFHLVDRNTHVELIRLLHVFRSNGDRAFVKALLLRANLITDWDKRVLTGLLLLYAVMYTVEGVGLWLRQRWAEYFAVAMTVIPLPFELQTLVHHASHARGPVLHSHVFVLKIVVLLVNVGIVWFLIHHLRRSARKRVSAPSA